MIATACPIGALSPRRVARARIPMPRYTTPFPLPHIIRHYCHVLLPNRCPPAWALSQNKRNAIPGAHINSGTLPMGRPPIYRVAMTPAERQRRFPLW